VGVADPAGRTRLRPIDVRVRTAALNAAATALAPSFAASQKLNLNLLLGTAEKIEGWILTGQRPSWPDWTETPTH
jgi:hypothetical protein